VQKLINAACVRTVCIYKLPHLLLCLRFSLRQLPLQLVLRDSAPTGDEKFVCASKVLNSVLLREGCLDTAMKLPCVNIGALQLSQLR
jgi:hypothetical protein